VGNVALQHARLAGATTTIGIDLDAKRCEYAEAVGATGTVQLGLELLGWQTEDPSFMFGDLYFKEGQIDADPASIGFQAVIDWR
jgi:threonine dehydrogenase-like Zn-dependent dehydrogenase